ncbi:MAG TPA: hypothetical protein VGF92_02790, partial [Stellaceae bacterium]
MSGIDPTQLRQRIIVPTLLMLGNALGGTAAEEILLGIALQESSGGHWLAQINGPARGIWEMEKATHDDIWVNFLKFNSSLAVRVSELSVPVIDRVEQLAGNLYYACAMARIDLLRAPEPLPPAGDIAAQADYYKRHYNSARGKATVDEYLANWRAAFPNSFPPAGA